MKVFLLGYTPNPVELVALAAKNCYSTATAGQLRDDMTPEKAKEFVEMLASLGHESPIEHANFTFAIEGVSRALLAQITRHRLASYSVKSQRYVSEKEFEYVTPPAIAADDEALAAFEEAMEADRASYKKISGILYKKYCAELEAEGKLDKASKSAARKRAGEDARFVLPNACTTQIVMTMNARSLKNFFSQRMCNRAQWEIRELAERMRELVIEAAPELFRDAGPGCLRGGCPEGRMTCGRAAEMRKKYLKEE